MRVVESKHVEDCFDGSLIKEVLFDSPVTKEFVFKIGADGTIQYFDNFAKPFFKIRLQGIYDIKGIAGHKTIRIHLKSPDKYTLVDFENDVAAA